MNAITFAYPAISLFIYTGSPAQRNLCVCRIGFADTQRLHNGVTKVTPLHLINAPVARTR